MCPRFYHPHSTSLGFVNAQSCSCMSADVSLQFTTLLIFMRSLWQHISAYSKDAAVPSWDLPCLVLVFAHPDGQLQRSSASPSPSPGIQNFMSTFGSSHVHSLEMQLYVLLWVFIACSHR